jgi:DNA-binding MarR family transcriptional regulator
MPRHKSANLASGSPWLEDVASKFADQPNFAWLLAAGAIVQVYRAVSARAEDVLRPLDLTMSRYEILAFLDSADGGTMGASDLKRGTLLHPPTMTYTLDWLEQRGLVERRPSTLDRRSISVRITEAGRALFGQAHTALGDIHFGLSGVGEQDALAVARVLARATAD